MRSFALAAGLFAVASLASPLKLAARGGSEPCDENAAPCLTYDQATEVANHFKELIADYSDEKADQYLTADFTDYSDSVNELINSGCTDGPAPLGTATFTSRDAFEAGQSTQDPIPFEILNLWHNCDTVIIRWRTSLTPQFVTGIIVMETEYDDGEFDIKTVYSEFNSGAWLVDLGVFQPTCPAPAPSKRSISSTPFMGML